MYLIVYDDTFFYRQILSSGDSDLNTLTFIDVKSCTIASFNSFNSFNSRRICKSKLRLINHLYCQNAEDRNNVICLQSCASITNSHHIDSKLIIFNR